MARDHFNLDDEELWGLLRTGDQIAYEELYRRYFQVLFSFGTRVCADTEAVNDAIQDLFVYIWRTRSSITQAESVKFYLFTSLRRKIIRELKSPRGPIEDVDTVSEAQLPFQDSPETIFSGQEEVLLQVEKLNSWLERIPPRQKQALLLRYYHNFDYPAIAILLTIKEQTARNLVQKALHILRKIAIAFIVFGFCS